MTLTPTAGDAAGALRALITGTVIEPANPEYDQARRIWNGMIDPRPALIVRPSTAVDVATAIRFARERDLPIAVRGGGHNVAGLANVDDGLVIDLSSIHGVEGAQLREPPGCSLHTVNTDQCRGMFSGSIIPANRVGVRVSTVLFCSGYTAARPGG